MLYLPLDVIFLATTAKIENELQRKILTLTDYLQRDAELYPNKVAVICGEEACTYRQLWEK